MAGLLLTVSAITAIYTVLKRCWETRLFISDDDGGESLIESEAQRQPLLRPYPDLQVPGQAAVTSSVRRVSSPTSITRRLYGSPNNGGYQIITIMTNNEFFSQTHFDDSNIQHLPTSPITPPSPYSSMQQSNSGSIFTDYSKTSSTHSLTQTSEPQEQHMVVDIIPSVSQQSYTSFDEGVLEPQSSCQQDVNVDAVIATTTQEILESTTGAPDFEDQNDADDNCWDAGQESEVQELDTLKSKIKDVQEKGQYELSPSSSDDSIVDEPCDAETMGSPEQEDGSSVTQTSYSTNPANHKTEIVKNSKNDEGYVSQEDPGCNDNQDPSSNDKDTEHVTDNTTLCEFPEEPFKDSDSKIPQISFRSILTTVEKAVAAVSPKSSYGHDSAKAILSSDQWFRETTVTIITKEEKEAAYPQNNSNGISDSDHMEVVQDFEKKIDIVELGQSGSKATAIGMPYLREEDDGNNKEVTNSGARVVEVVVSSNIQKGHTEKANSAQKRHLGCHNSRRQQQPQHSKHNSRCFKWPRCTNAKCSFHHPKEICKFYPFCRFVDSPVRGGGGGAMLSPTHHNSKNDGSGRKFKSRKCIRCIKLHPEDLQPLQQAISQTGSRKFKLRDLRKNIPIDSGNISEVKKYFDTIVLDAARRSDWNQFVDENMVFDKHLLMVNLNQTNNGTTDAFVDVGSGQFHGKIQYPNFGQSHHHHHQQQQQQFIPTSTTQMLHYNHHHNQIQSIQLQQQHPQHIPHYF
ncbi:hypothetical protein H4219_005712 [Mycoemilia scoparia]|uniref:Uncharacterized protein n=1 Tax=Mycoemilia scoparia TaxID=417184 RepID=A0A9W7ZTH3_9FUNG|nr:hypothetical protein H4219_005712 [Mycoemilia scoparia]